MKDPGGVGFMLSGAPHVGPEEEDEAVDMPVRLAKSAKGSLLLVASRLGVLEMRGMCDGVGRTGIEDVGLAVNKESQLPKRFSAAAEVLDGDGPEDETAPKLL